MSLIQAVADRTPSQRALYYAAGAGVLLAVGALAFHAHPPELSLVAEASPAVRIHMAAALSALVVALFLLARAKGTRMHRIVGWIWATAMMVAALSSFLIMQINHGHLSYIHILSGWTAFATPLGVWQARRRKVKLHSRTMSNLVVGGLIVAGLFTFIPGRLMWRVFFG